jgi:hypothetical protein
MLRIHGIKVVEVPFIGIVLAYQKQGVMHHLVSGVEQVRASVQVEKLMIPAISSLVDKKKRFSFRPMNP